MRLDLRQTALLFGHELRSLLRDRKTLALTVLLPLAIMPVMLLANRYVEQSTRAREEARTYHYAVTGREADRARALMALGLESRAGGDTSSWKLEEVEVSDPVASLRDTTIDFYLDALSLQQTIALDDSLAASADEEDAEADSLADPFDRITAPAIRVVYRGNRHASRTGADRAQLALDTARDLERERLLDERGLAVHFDDVYPVEETSVAETGQVAGSALGRYLTLLVVFMILAGGVSVSSDLVAGEKERGTLETLLTTGIGRAEIITGKVLLVTAVALLILFINMVNLLVYVGFGAIPLPAGLGAALTPTSMIVLLLLFLPVAVMVAGVLLLVSSFAKTYKEAQTYFFPLQFAMIIPPLAAFLPGIELRSIVAIVPLANVSVAVREVLVGTFDWPMLALTWLVTAGAAAYVVRAAGKLLAGEDYILAGGVQDTRMMTGPARFSRQLPVWLVVLWGVFLIVNLNYPPGTDLRLQLFINLIVLFFGATLLMTRVYRLPPREALGLKAPRKIVWLGVLLGAPVTPFVAQIVARLAGTLLPVPERALEAFAKMLLPEDIPTWQLVAMLSVLPGICEELLFRGLFIYGFRRRLGPVALVIASGLVFGLFHVDLFRIAPTTTIGIVLATVTVLSGSVLPAMLWHAVSNGTAVVMQMKGFGPDRFGHLGTIVAVVMFVVAIGLIWRGRSSRSGHGTPPPPHEEAS